MPAKKPTFEEAMARLEEIVAAMERGEAPLEKSLELFAEGTELLKQCTTLLDKAEQQVTKFIRGSNGEPVEVPMEEMSE